MHQSLKEHLKEYSIESYGTLANKMNSWPNLNSFRKSRDCWNVPSNNLKCEVQFFLQHKIGEFKQSNSFLKPN